MLVKSHFEEVDIINDIPDHTRHHSSLVPKSQWTVHQAGE